MADQPRKPLHFIASSLKDLQRLPEPVQDVFGSALLDVQYGDEPEGSRTFGEGLPSAVRKLVEDFDGDTFRAAYTVAFPNAVYVLHVFRKVEVWHRNAASRPGSGACAVPGGRGALRADVQRITRCATARATLREPRALRATHA